MRRLKQYYLYHFSNKIPRYNCIVQVTKTYELSDSFKGISLTSTRAWHNSLKVTEENWEITEMGPMENYPEYFL